MKSLIEKSNLLPIFLLSKNTCRCTREGEINHFHSYRRANLKDLCCSLKMLTQKGRKKLLDLYIRFLCLFIPCSGVESESQGRIRYYKTLHISILSAPSVSATFYYRSDNALSLHEQTLPWIRWNFLVMHKAWSSLSLSLWEDAAETFEESQKRRKPSCQGGLETRSESGKPSCHCLQQGTHPGWHSSPLGVLGVLCVPFPAVTAPCLALPASGCN